MNHQIDETRDLSTIASTPIDCRIPPDVVAEVLSQPPFLPIPGALNIRDISVAPYVRKHLIYRSGGLGHLQQSAESSLSDKYGIRTIFDLRTRAERDQRPSPEIESIKTVWTPSTEKDGVDEQVLRHIDPQDFVDDGGKIGYLKVYTNILNSHKAAFKAVLLHLRDQKENGILFHCTGNFLAKIAAIFRYEVTQVKFSAGKDRTGVLAALILGLAGAPAEAIARDFALTRIGIEPAREQLLAIFLAQSGFTVDQPGFAEMCSIHATTMLSFLEMVEQKWGGVEGYIQKELGIGERDLELIKENLRMK